MRNSVEIVNDMISTKELLDRKRKRYKIAHRLMFLKYIFIVFSVVLNILSGVFSLKNSNVVMIPYFSFLSSALSFISGTINIYDIDKIKDDIRRLEMEYEQISSQTEMI